ncbi:MAG: SurA N-terminal domain-containing protein [Thermodesulforhabdaceae bacterium]
MRTKFFFFAVFFVVFFSVASVGRSFAENVDRIVAVVNDDIILYSDVRKKVKEIKDKIRSALPVPESELERQILDQMVEEKLIQQEMKRLKINVDDQSVERAIEKIKKDQGLTDDQFFAMIQKEGFTLEEFKKTIRKELERATLIEKVFQSKTIITDADIDQYVKKHPEESVPRAKLSVIFIPKNSGISGEELLKRIKSGADFYELAKKYSKGPNASEGGRVGWVNVRDLAGKLQEVVINLPPGQISPVLSSDAGDFIVKVEEKTVESVALNPSDPKEREKIRRMLMQREIETKFKDWMKNLREKAYIRVSL